MRRLEAELAKAKQDHAKLYEAWEKGKAKNAKLTNMLVESKRMLSSFFVSSALPILNCHSHSFVLCPSFAEKTTKSKEILKVHKDVEVLKDQIEVLQKEREENLKLHEATVKSYQESSEKEINDLKSDILEKNHMLGDWQDQHHKDEETIK